jgi:hypothetical protein
LVANIPLLFSQVKTPEQSIKIIGSYNICVLNDRLSCKLTLQMSPVYTQRMGRREEQKKFRYITPDIFAELLQ